MFSHTVTLLLTITFYCTLGSPVSTVHSIDKLLNALIGRCKNQFLVPQIKEKISECSLRVPSQPFNSEQLKCLIFYDMSEQLCDVNSTKPFSLEASPIKESIDTICDNIAKTWKFSDLTIAPNYKTTAEKVFNKPEYCKKVCEVLDVFTDDTNSFCKYYKWGSEILKMQANTIIIEKKTTNNKIVDSVPGHIINTVTKMNSLATSNNTVASIIKNSETNINNKATESDLPIIQTTITNAHENDGTGVAKNKISTPLQVAVSGLDHQQESEQYEINAPIQTADTIINNVQHSVVQKTGYSDKPDIEKILPQEEVPPKKDDIEKEVQLLNNQKDISKDDKDTIDDIEDDTDIDEEDKQDLHDDSEISIGKAESPKLEEKKKENINIDVPLITSHAGVKSQDFISKIPQDDFPEDDDHFISFFLTAVIIVVLLYILYHNKNKFTKVVLGLIVEGRQHGRRRNSRGHAYRRLDTLEQAMSTNSPAPPSKIIY